MFTFVVPVEFRAVASRATTLPPHPHTGSPEAPESDNDATWTPKALYRAPSSVAVLAKTKASRAIIRCHRPDWRPLCPEVASPNGRLFFCDSAGLLTV
jgi:hypothetical protein